jgi:hypothetical protein
VVEEKTLTGGEGNGGNRQPSLQTVLSKLRGARSIFPLAETMAEGLVGVKAAVTAEVRGDLDSIRGKAAGIEQAATEMKSDVAGAKHLAGILDSLALTSGGQSYKGAEALGKLVEVIGAVEGVAKKAAATAETAEKAAGKAVGEAETATKEVAELKTELAKTRREFDIAIGVINLLLARNGLDTSVSPGEIAEIEAAADEPDTVTNEGDS